jgi:cytochrome d ubiquinol oxidase subunit II
LGTAAVTGLVGLAGIFVLRADAPALADGLLGRALPVIIVSVLAGVASIALLVVRRYAQARLTSSLAVATILLGWAAAQFPYILPPQLTIEDAAAGHATLVAMLVSLILGSILLVPSLIYLYRLFQRAGTDAPASYPGPG